MGTKCQRSIKVMVSSLHPHSEVQLSISEMGLIMSCRNMETSEIQGDRLWQYCPFDVMIRVRASIWLHMLIPVLWKPNESLFVSFLPLILQYYEISQILSLQNI